MKITKILIAHNIESGQTIRIEGDEFHYLSRVKRQRQGDKIVLLTGGGRQFSGTLVRLGEDHGEATIEDELPESPTIWPVHLLVAVPKHHLMDELIRRVSEIGIESVQPISTERSVQKAGKTRGERWKKIAAESQRQCSRSSPLHIEDLCDLKEALSEKPPGGVGYLFHPTGPGFFGPDMESGTDSPIFLAVGPEGGFSPVEVELAASLDYQMAGLGHSILRIETAAVTASVLAVARLGGYSHGGTL